LNAFNASAISSDILNFLRGERINEYPTGGLRLRFSVLGDIIHSNPEYVAAPEANIVDSSYVSFANANAARAPRVYVGANDGMLHAFDAATGDEVWAYVPSMVVGNMSKLAGRPYAHSYYVDGGITVQDAFFSGAWHSVLIGSLGGGGKGLFALDVTHPDLSENFNTGNNKKVLWEIDVRYNWSTVIFKVCVSLLIFCLVDLSIGVSGVLKSPTIIVLLLISPFILVSICLTYYGAPFLVHIHL